MKVDFSKVPKSVQIGCYSPQIVSVHSKQDPVGIFPGPSTGPLFVLFVKIYFILIMLNAFKGPVKGSGKIPTGSYSG